MQNLTCKAMMRQGATTGSEGVILNDKNPDEYNDAVFVSTVVYHALFGAKAARPSNYWRGNIVKIAYNGHKIHRRVLIGAVKKGELVMTYESIGEISYYENDGLQRPTGKEVAISRGCRFLYWFKHPNPAARISFHIGLISIALSLISIGLAFWQILV